MINCTLRPETLKIKGQCKMAYMLIGLTFAIDSVHYVSTTSYTESQTHWLLRTAPAGADRDELPARSMLCVPRTILENFRTYYIY